MRIVPRLSLENASTPYPTAALPHAGEVAGEDTDLPSGAAVGKGETTDANVVEMLVQRMHTATPEAKVAAVAEVFRRQLAKHQQREIAYGVSLVGPHRDDLVFLVDDRDMTTYGSRGQRRTVVLSLKLAEMEFMRKKTGEEPILLLDDVASELDAQRRRHLIEAVRTRQQVIVTTTDVQAFEGEFLTKALLLRLENGALQLS